MESRYCITLDDYERRIVVNCMNQIRNQLNADGKCTDDVDDILLKIIDAKTKRFRMG